jgi:ferredoxin-thioredoxin reductase catalytic chain
MSQEIEENKIESLYQELSAFMKRGYFLNPDHSFTKDLIKSLLINQARYGYQACPCRLASGVKKEDLDIICPCDYRDADVAEYGTCFCGLYVSNNIYENKLPIKPIPERRVLRAIKK